LKFESLYFNNVSHFYELINFFPNNIFEQKALWLQQQHKNPVIKITTTRELKKHTLLCSFFVYLFDSDKSLRFLILIFKLFKSNLKFVLFLLIINK